MDEYPVDFNHRIGTYNYEFKLTCGACPEQYDVYLEGVQVGYVRLRWGTLRCDVPDVMGHTVFSHSFEGDSSLKGCFDSYDETKFYLEAIAKAIYNYNSQAEIDHEHTTES